MKGKFGYSLIQKMTILPNQLNIACIFVSRGYLVSKGNKDGVALALLTAPPRSHRKCGCVRAENEELELFWFTRRKRRWV